MYIYGMIVFCNWNMLVLCEVRAEAEEKADLVIFVPRAILNIAIYELNRKILYLAI